MDDSQSMRIRHCVGHRDDIREQRDSLIERWPLGNEISQRTAGDHLHRVERFSLWPLPGLVNRHDRWMLQARGQPGLAYESPSMIRVVRNEFLDRHDATEPLIVREQNSTEAAARVLAFNFIVCTI